MTYTEEDFRRIGDQVRNWGRWGDDDQIGTLNLITPECLQEAAKLVRRGVSFDLGIPFDGAGPQLGKNGRINPLHYMTETGADQDFPGGFRYADDYVVMPLQGASQWDGLSHVFYDDKLYNGYPSSEVTPHGAKTLDIAKIGKGVAGRGVLLDIAALKGVEWLPAGEVITPEDLDAAAARQKVEIKSGDIILLRTGWRRKFITDGSAAEFMAGEPGIGMAAIEWLSSHEIAAIALGQLGHRGPVADRRRVLRRRDRGDGAAGPLHPDPRHGPDARRDHGLRGARRRLRQRRRLRVLPLRTRPQVHRRRRLAGEPPRLQVRPERR